MSVKVFRATTAVLIGLLTVVTMAPGAPPRRQGKKPIASRGRTAGRDQILTMGHALFVTNCSPCHGVNAEGDDGPNLHEQGLSDAFVTNTIKSGFKSEMPSFGVKLKGKGVKALTAYVHSLQKR